MIEKQYYTPTIEEFHVGFECEKYIESHPEGFWSEVPEQMSPKDLSEIYSLVPLAQKDNTYLENYFRVKYLDRGDVEELGWKVIKEPYRWQFAYEEDRRYMMITDIYTGNESLPIPHPNSGSIKIIDNRDADNYVIFHGYIKNKSELKRIMKQLDILNFKE